jgi:hypothetical protein
MTGNHSWKRAYRQMGHTVRALHEWADATVNQLEGNPILDADTAEADEARAALENARAWRARVEAGA